MVGGAEGVATNLGHSSSLSRLSSSFVVLDPMTVSHNNRRVIKLQQPSSLGNRYLATLEGCVWLEVWFLRSPHSRDSRGCPWRK